MEDVKHFECPLQDWSEDVEDEVTGYVDLMLHELIHPKPPVDSPVDSDRGTS